MAMAKRKRLESICSTRRQLNQYCSVATMDFFFSSSLIPCEQVVKIAMELEIPDRNSVVAPKKVAISIK